MLFIRCEQLEYLKNITWSRSIGYLQLGNLLFDPSLLKIGISLDSIDINRSNLGALLQIGSRLPVLKIKTIG